MTDAITLALGRMAERSCYFVYMLTWNTERAKYDKRPASSPAAAAMTYTAAHAEVMRLRAGGQAATVGMWLAADSGLYFLDIDQLPADYKTDTRAKELMAMFPGAFVEWSVGKRGLHVIGTLAKPVQHSCRNDPLHLELYTQDRGVALNIDAVPTGCMDAVHDVSAMVAQYFPPRAVPIATQGVRPEWRGPSDDAVLMERALRAKVSAAAAFGGKVTLQQLWAGDCDRNSHADATLASHLAFWTGCDEERIERLMRSTPMVRDKWNTARPGGTYLSVTIANACEACTNVYVEPLRALPLPVLTAPPQTQGMIRNAADLLQQDFKPVQWAIRDILPEGVTILSGDPKIGKSWLVYQASVAIATGSAMWEGREPEVQGDALMLALEDTDRRLRRRLDILLAGFPGKRPDRLHYATDWPRALAGVAAIAEWLREHPDCRLVVIDTISAFRDPDPGRLNAYANDYAVGEMLKPLAREFSCAIVIVMHNRKQAAGDVMHKVSGTQGMTGSVDNVLILERSRGESDAVLHVDGRDIEQQREMALRLHAGLWSYLGEADDVQRSKERCDVLDGMATMGGCGTAKEIHESIGSGTLNAVKIRLSRMHKAGDIEKNGNIYTRCNPVSNLTPPKLPAA